MKKQETPFEVIVTFSEDMKRLGELAKLNLCVRGVAYKIHVDDFYGVPSYEYEYDVNEILYIDESGVQANVLPLIRGLNSGSEKECLELDREIAKKLPELFSHYRLDAA